MEDTKDDMHWIPYRASSENNEDAEMMDDDAMERVVLFDDVKSFLFRISDPHTLEQLLCHFLEHIGMTFVGCLKVECLPLICISTDKCSLLTHMCAQA